MSTSDHVSVLELMKGELDKFQTMKSEMEKVVNERDSLKKVVEELKLKKIKYKTRARQLEDWMLKASLSASAAATPLPTPFPNKPTGKRKADDCCETKEAAVGFNCDSGIAICTGIRTQAKVPQINVGGYTYQFTAIINKIEKNLKQENLEKFERSCFGHLLKMNELKFQGQLLLQLLMHIDVSASNKERLIFKINNSNIEFGPREFSLITGLRLGTLEATAAPPTSASSIQKNVFKGQSTILLKDIEQHFLDVSRRVGPGNDEMSLKLALLYFLYGLFFCGYPWKQVDWKYFTLIEDLEEFNAFPWGRVAYEFLVSSLLLARSHIDDSKDSLKKPSMINIFGFSYGLQVWAYEVMMPALAQYCAVRTTDLDDPPIPRILRWSTLNKKVYARDLEKFFTPDDEAHSVLPGIRPSPWELEALTTGTIPQPEKGKLLTDKDQVFPAATPLSSANALIHRPACVSTQTNSDMVKAKMKMQIQPLVEKCSTVVTGAIPKPEKGKLVTNIRQESRAEMQTSSVDALIHHPACVSTQANRDVVKAETQMLPPVKMCSPFVAGNVVIISDSDDDDDQSDSDAEFLSDRYMNKLVAKVQSKTSRE